MTSPPEPVPLVERRLDFLERLAEEPLRKHELVDALGHSRSTVNRAMDALEDGDLVARETDGYRTTLSGRLLAESYRAFLDDAAAVEETRIALEPLRADAGLAADALRGASVAHASGPDPYEPLERLDAAVSGADTVAAMLPALPYPRLLDHCRETVATGGTLHLVLGEALYEHAVDRFPDVLSALGSRDGSTVAVGVDEAYGLIRADDRLLVVVFADDGGVHAVTETTADAATTWGDTAIQKALDTARDVTADCRTLGGTAGAARGTGSGVDDGDEANAGGRSGPGGGSGPEAGPGPLGTSAATTAADTLSAQGFTTLDDDRLDRDPSPIGPLRAQATFADVAAGTVLDRELVVDGERRSLAGHLVDGLASGNDHALIGPPGSGKSTACRTVAVRWHQSGRGSVLYRSGDDGGSFSAREALRARATSLPGHTLVVVEDAVRPDAAEAVAVARGLADADDVSFLFDARAESYDDPDGTPLTAADLAYRRERVTTVRMPSLDERAVERFVAHVRELTDHPVTVDPADLAADVRTDEGPPQAERSQDRPGDLLLLFHRLVRAASPIPRSEVDETGLNEAVSRLHDDLAGRPPPTLDVAVLYNLLNAAGVSDKRQLVHALAGEGRTGGGRGGDGRGGRSGGSEDAPSHDAVRRALARLEGAAFVTDPDGRHRPVNAEWSVLFLDRLLAREPEPVVARRVGRVVTRLLGLAGDPARRNRLRREFLEPTAIDRIERDPGEWVHDLVRAVFDVGESYPRLAPIYGRTGYSWIDLPEASPPGLADRLPEWVARMYITAGDLDRAAAELDAWRPATARGEAACGRLRGDVARRRGECETAVDHHRNAARRFADIGDQSGEAGALRGLSQDYHFAGKHSKAYEEGSRSVAVALDADDPIDVARALMDVANALDARDEGGVVAHYQLARRILRRYDDRHGEANVCTNLCVALRRRGDLDAARRNGQFALSRYRTHGDELRELACLINLGAVAEQAGDLEDSADCFREAYAVADRVGVRSHRALARHNLGTTAAVAGEFEAAERHFDAAFATYDELDDEMGAARVWISRARLACRRDDPDVADRGLDHARPLLANVDAELLAAKLRLAEGWAARLREDHETATSALDAAVDGARDGGFMAVGARALAERGLVDVDRGDRETARDRLESAVAWGRDHECHDAVVTAASALADLLADTDPETAAAHRDTVAAWCVDGEVSVTLEQSDAGSGVDPESAR